MVGYLESRGSTFASFSASSGMVHHLFIFIKFIVEFFFELLFNKTQHTARWNLKEDISFKMTT